MAIDRQKAWNLTLEIIKKEKSIDLGQHLNKPLISSTRVRLFQHLELVKIILEIYENMIIEANNISDQNNLTNDTIVMEFNKSIEIAINGNQKEIKGFKENLGIYFNHGEFKRNLINRELVSESIILCVKFMFAQIILPDNIDVIKSRWSENRAKYFDLQYILSELLEIPNKYRILAV